MCDLVCVWFMLDVFVRESFCDFGILVNFAGGVFLCVVDGFVLVLISDFGVEIGGFSFLNLTV